MSTSWCIMFTPSTLFVHRFWLKRSNGLDEPDNWKVQDTSGENCGLVSKMGDWRDNSCKNLWKFVCETTATDWIGLDWIFSCYIWRLLRNIFIKCTQLFLHCGCKEPLSRPTTELGVGEGFCVFGFLRFAEIQYFIKWPYVGKHNSSDSSQFRNSALVPVLLMLFLRTGAVCP